MNVLEIEPNGAWWFEAESETELSTLREIAAGKRKGSDRWHEGRAYFLSGDAATFNLKSGTFDEIWIVSSGVTGRRSKLEKIAAAWLKKGGRLKNGTPNRKSPPALSAAVGASSPALIDPLSRCEVAAEAVVHSAPTVISSIGMI